MHQLQQNPAVMNNRSADGRAIRLLRVPANTLANAWGPKLLILGFA
jgi:hypothetical protein